MRNIIKDFKDGDATKRLSILSDLGTITSIVLVSLLIPAYSLAERTGLSFSAITAISMMAFLTVAGSLLSLAIFLSIDSWLAGQTCYRKLLRGALWSAAFAVAAFALAFLHELITSTHWT